MGRTTTLLLSVVLSRTAAQDWDASGERLMTAELRAKDEARLASRRLLSDSDEWYKTGEPSKDCEWVAEYPDARCGFSRGNMGVRGDLGWSYEMCAETCQKTSFVGAFLCEESDGYDIVESDFHPDFPPKDLIDVGYEKGEGFASDPELYDDIAEWFNGTFADYEYAPMDMTDKEKMMFLWTATEYVEAFKAGEVNATEYATALVKRLLHYQSLNTHFVTTYSLTDAIISQAEAIDAKAADEGMDAVAPLYGLPVPAKGTMSTVDFPSSAGLGVLDGCYGNEDAALVSLVKAAGGVIMGKTNVPEFACSWQTMNHLNGVTRSAYDPVLTVCGSSGGSASTVAAYIAPIAITEDTGGSTRCPAHANGNFGYDPPRNKYDNTGNPGITHFRDQLGTNARTFDDILLFDKAVLDMEEEHAAAEAAVDAMSLSDIVVGFPTEIFVNLNIPASVRNESLTTTRDRRASASLRAALETAKTMLGDGGVTVDADSEWSDVYSDTLGETMNTLYHMIWGIEYAPGQKFFYSVCAQTFTGQIAQYMHNFLRVSDTTIADVIDDTRPVGAHNPAGCFRAYTGKSDESELRYCAVYQTEAAAMWNSYFNETGVDMIITPTQYTSTQTYAENAESSIPIEIKQDDGSYVEENSGSTSDTGSIHYSYFKMLHIPKVVVPVGLDAKGRPISLTIWGKAMPAEETFCDSCSFDFDTEWLYKVKKVVDILHAEGSELARVDSTLAMMDVLA